MDKIYNIDRCALDAKVLEAFEVLENQGLTQQDIAEILGITRPAVNFLKHGTQGKGPKKKPYERPPWQVQRLAEMAGMSPKEFGLEDYSTRLSRAKDFYVLEAFAGNGPSRVFTGYKYGITNDLNARKTGINRDKPLDHVLKYVWSFKKDGQAYFCEEAVLKEFGRCELGEYVFERKDELIPFIQSVADFQTHEFREN